MPYIVADDARLAQRINNAIYLDILEMAPPARLQDGLKYTRRGTSFNPISEMSFKVSRNDKSLLVLSLDYEYLGAYSENYTTHFNFESATGRPIVATELFTRAGIAAISQRVDAIQAAQWRAHIVKLRKQIKSAGKLPAKRTKNAELEDTVDDLDAAVFMYETCVEQLKRKQSDAPRRSELSSMRIGERAVTFVRERCSNHAMRALDPLDKISATVSFTELTPHLSSYGKYVLLKADWVAPTGGLFGQVLFGKIGSSPISLRFNERRDGQNISALYYYDKFRTPISLSGELSGNTLVLTENDEEGKPTAEIRATLRGDSLKGRWVSGDKQLDFEVSP